MIYGHIKIDAAIGPIFCARLDPTDELRQGGPCHASSVTTSFRPFAPVRTAPELLPAAGQLPARTPGLNGAHRARDVNDQTRLITASFSGSQVSVLLRTIA